MLLIEWESKKYYNLNYWQARGRARGDWSGLQKNRPVSLGRFFGSVPKVGVEPTILKGTQTDRQTEGAPPLRRGNPGEEQKPREYSILSLYKERIQDII